MSGVDMSKLTLETVGGVVMLTVKASSKARVDKII